MPQYVFVCASCQKEFTLIMHMDERGKAEIRCPECGGERVQPQVSRFSAVTGKKS